MILTDRQKSIRTTFRDTIIDNWLSNEKTMMFNTVYAVANLFNITPEDAKDEMACIPSIGCFRDNTPINVWVAKYFNDVSNALWDGKDKAYIIKLWAKTKKTSDVNPKVKDADKKEFNMINKSRKKLAALSEFYKNEPDRNNKSAWNKVK